MFPLDISYLRPKLGDDNRLYWRYGAEYADKILGYSPIAYWPLWEADGSTAEDISGNGFDGAYVDVTLGADGIGDGRTCPLFDGAAGYMNAFSTGLRDAFNGAEGSFAIWAKVFNVGVWTDGNNNRRLAELRVDGNNRVEHYKDGNNSIKWTYEAGNTTETLSKGSMTTTDWFQTFITWSKKGEVVKYYHNGASAGSDDVNLGIWVGNLSATETCIGSNDTTPNYLWHGWLAHPAIFDTVKTPTEILDMYSI